MQAMIARGRTLMEIGDVSGARLLFRHAAEAGSGEAALLLGSTFDPHALEALGARGIAPDSAAARNWYRRAAELGEQGAADRLRALDEASGEAQR